MFIKKVKVLFRFTLLGFLLTACSNIDTSTKSEEQTPPATTDAVTDQSNVAAEEKVSTAAAAATDKPYQIVDGKVSANVMEGWKTYNGGGCGACHGKGGIGAVAPALGVSVTTKLSKEQFMDLVINGKPGTLMRPNKINKRVMDNLDNLYAYLLARGDDVIGPENLIKYPLGKSE